MGELAEKLILENIKTQNPMLDLGRCGLDGTEEELYKLLQSAKYLEVLILSDYYWFFDSEKEIYVGGETQNKGKRNHLIQIPKYLPQNLKKLTLNGDIDCNETPAKIKDYSPLLELKNLEHLELDFQKNLDLEIISQITSLQVLTCFHNKKLKAVHLLANLQQLSFLDLSQTDIEEVDFINKIPSLEHLFLEGNEIKNLSVLSFLKGLKTLDLTYNEMFLSLDFLKNLKELRKLSLKNCELEEEADKIRHLKQLKYLNLAYNKLNRVDFLAELTQLEELDISENQIHDLKPIKNLTKLKKLDLFLNKIHDLDPLQNLTNLEDLNIRYNGEGVSIALDFLWDLTKLKKLDLERSNSQDLGSLKNLENLEELNLSSNKLESLDDLPSLPKLKKLTINYNKIQDITAVGNLKSLEYLDISHNPIENIEILQGLKKLKRFVAWDTKLCSLEPLSHCKALETLRIYKSFSIDKVEILKDLINLKHLTLYAIGLKDISFLRNLKALTNLNLNNNKIKDISPIAYLGNLNFLHLEGNLIEDVQPLKHLPFIFDFKIDNTKLSKPPIWYAYAKWWRKEFSHYTHLPELLYVEKTGT